MINQPDQPEHRPNRLPHRPGARAIPVPLPGTASPLDRLRDAVENLIGNLAREDGKGHTHAAEE